MRRWELVRCWEGATSTLVPSPTGYRYFTRWGAERVARRMTAAMTTGVWYEVARVE